MSSRSAGFRVTVYEASRTTGGKARSIFVPGTGTGGRRDLPGEHGLRFFPSFYRHLPDTMRRIPFGRNPNGVAGNLVATSRTRLARIDGPSFDVLTRFPTGYRDVADAVKLVVRSDVDLPRHDLVFVGNLLLTLLTSSRERRFQQYENQPWWEFVQADRRSRRVPQVLLRCGRALAGGDEPPQGQRAYHRRDRGADLDRPRPTRDAGRPAAERPDPRRLAHSLARLSQDGSASASASRPAPPACTSRTAGSPASASRPRRQSDVGRPLRRGRPGGAMVPLVSAAVMEPTRRWRTCPGCTRSG